jgi:glyoxylase-like metal-dependent hydrolase (beta-lactamase superfamily II)
MILKAILNGMFDSNCYVLGDNGEGAVIDPGADVEDIAKVLEAHDLKLKYIILTHAHIDHITEVDNLRNAVGGVAVVHEDDAPLLGDQLLNGSALFGRGRTFDKADVLVKDGDVLELGGAKLRVIHTPGHTPGGICILASGRGDEGGRSDASEDVGSGTDSGINGGSGVDEGVNGSADGGVDGVVEGTNGRTDEGAVGSGESYLFTGDTLFKLSIGRTDLGAGDHRKITESVRRLMKLDGSLKVYPGHGPATTIDYERLNNPWL